MSRQIRSNELFEFDALLVAFQFEFDELAGRSMSKEEQGRGRRAASKPRPAQVPRQLSEEGLLFRQSPPTRTKTPMKPSLRIVTPTTVNRTVTPRRRPNAEIRTREHLTEAEVEKLIKAAARTMLGSPRCHHDPGRLPPWPARQRTGRPALGSDRLSPEPFCTSAGSSRARPPHIPSGATNYGRCASCSGSRNRKSPFVFTSERGSPFTTSGFAKLMERAGEAAGLGFPAHPHMLRHACGFALANKGHDTRALQAYLGHKNIQHTVRYTELSPDRFKDFWRGKR